MKPHKLLMTNGYTPKSVKNFPELARTAKKLARNGHSAEEILQQIAELADVRTTLRMRDTPGPYKMYGTPGHHFQYNAKEQMDAVASVPPFIKGALMPDAHLGYGMPIGGVAALDRAVSPFFVGYDIACRVSLTLLPLTPDELRAERENLLDDLLAETSFGFNDFKHKPRQHPVMDDPLWTDKSLPLRRYLSKAAVQLGSSGGGNHFADLMVGEVTQKVDWLPLEPGQSFTALMTHSGSRGVGHRMATHYSKLAHQETQRIADKINQKHAWLPTDHDAGREYLAVMNLMGRYAAANHHLIHAHFLARTGLTPLDVDGTRISLPHITRPFTLLENHHNFAWVQDNGQVIHRKGATPADAGKPGLIPGTSGTHSYVVEGLGDPDSLNSSSHGAGRDFSRREAYRRHDAEAHRTWMRRKDILAHGVAPDESYQAYKNIDVVMSAQEDVLVRTVAKLFPVAVLMGGKSDDGD